MPFVPAPFEIKQLTAEGSFTGLASVFGTEDQGGDVVVPGAFRASLERHAREGTRPVMLRDHDPAQPVGTWSRIAETAEGLEVEGKLTLGVEKARETLALLRDGALTGLSIGYRTKTATRDRTTGARRLEEVDLVEISLVALPMNTGARVLAVKADEIGTKRCFEKFLRDAGFSRQRAKTLATGFRPAPTGQRDAAALEVSELVREIKSRAAAMTT